MILGKYNQSKTITFDLVAPDGIDLITAATFAAGDVVIMKDEGAEASTTNLPTDEGTGYSLVLTATEMSAARIRVYVIDQTATKVWLDVSLGIETYGNASAEHAFDLDTAANWNVGKTGYSISGTVTTLDGLNDFDPAADTVANVTLTDTTTTNTDMRGTDSAATASALATAQADLDIITDTDGVILGAAGVDLIYDESQADHIANGSIGRSLQLAGAILVDTTIAGTPTSTTIQLTAGSTQDNYYLNQKVYVTDGSGGGQSKICIDYVGATKVLTLDESYIVTPSNGNRVVVQSDHQHTESEIAIAVRAEMDSNSTQLAAIEIDTNDLQTNQGNWLTAIGFATEAKQDAQDLIITEARLTELDAANLPADIAAIKADTAAILIDTNELQGDWTNGGRLDVIIDAILDDTGTSGVVLAVAERNSIADAILDRDMATGADSGSTTVRTVRQALRANRNKVSISGGVMTVTKEDDSTASWTAAITTTAGDPISEVNPAGGS